MQITDIKAHSSMSMSVSMSMRSSSPASASASAGSAPSTPGSINSSAPGTPRTPGSRGELDGEFDSDDSGMGVSPIGKKSSKSSSSKRSSKSPKRGSRRSISGKGRKSTKKNIKQKTTNSLVEALSANLWIYSLIDTICVLAPHYHSTAAKTSGAKTLVELRRVIDKTLNEGRCFDGSAGDGLKWELPQRNALMGCIIYLLCACR